VRRLPRLDDLFDVDELCAWIGVVEKKAGVFYVHREPLLHFHLLAGERREAHVKGQDRWTHIHLPYPVSAARRQALLRELRLRYAEKTGPTTTRRSR